MYNDLKCTASQYTVDGCGFWPTLIFEFLHTKLIPYSEAYKSTDFRRSSFVQSDIKSILYSNDGNIYACTAQEKRNKKIVKSILEMCFAFWLIQPMYRMDGFHLFISVRIDDKMCVVYFYVFYFLLFKMFMQPSKETQFCWAKMGNYCHWLAVWNLFTSHKITKKKKKKQQTNRTQNVLCSNYPIFVNARGNCFG